MQITEAVIPETENSKSYGTTLLLCFLGGAFGLHRIYTGYTLIGIFQLLTGGGWGIWAFIDLVSLWLNKFRDANGKELEGYDSVCVWLTILTYLLAPIIILLLFIKGGF